MAFNASKFFRINTYKSVSKQSTLSVFRMNTYAKPPGEGAVMGGVQTGHIPDGTGRPAPRTPRPLPPSESGHFKNRMRPISEIAADLSEGLLAALVRTKQGQPGRIHHLSRFCPERRCTQRREAQPDSESATSDAHKNSLTVAFWLSRSDAKLPAHES